MNEIVGTRKQFKSILKELGFHTGKVLGVWQYSEKLSPGNNIEVVHFIKGNFWINKGKQRVFTSNYRTLTVDDFIKELIKVTDNV